MSTSKQPRNIVTLLLSVAALAAAQSGTYSKMNGYLLPGGSDFPAGITAGPDGAMWIAENGCYGGACGIGRITTTGSITQYGIPTPNAGPTSITKGPDGALWFTENIGQIGRITTEGVITEYPVPTPGSGPNGITAGPDGALWFTESHTSRIGQITTSGAITEFPVTIANETYLGSIATGSDGALWFTWSGYDVAGVARMTTSGSVTAYQAPASYGPFNLAAGITAGPDGALWFADTSGNIWRITTSGVLTQYPVPIRPSGGGTGPITTGPDGAIWFGVTCNPCTNDEIGRLTTAGIFTEFPVPSDGSIGGIAPGPDGALWSTDTGFDLEIESGVYRTPACALGLSASYTNKALTLNFNLGNDTPATWSVLFGDTSVVNTPIPPVVPPRSFTIDFNNIRPQGDVAVKSQLSKPDGQVICAEWMTVNTGQ